MYQSAFKIIAVLAIVGLIGTLVCEGNLMPLIVVAGVAWVVWQVAGGFSRG